MSTDRVAVVEGNLDDYLSNARAETARLDPGAPVRPGTGLTARKALEVFEDQYLSRALDVAARELKKQNRGFYTISSAGHEQNAILGAMLRPTDPCFLHYRSGGLMMARMRQVPGSTPSFDTLLSFCASSQDPVSGGRHKVWGSRAAWTPPQTSTIASHVPKAVGAAFALGRSRRVRVDDPGSAADPGLPADTIVCCTLGDASVNHATALAGINSARYAKRRDNPTPILIVCEDNQRGISVETPRRWIRDFFSNLPNMRYFGASGDMAEVWDNVSLAVHTCRTARGPVFLRLKCVRLWGHAGSDVETAYLSRDEIERIEAADPVLANARFLIETGAASPEVVRAIVSDTRERVAAARDVAATRPHLTDAAQIASPLMLEEPERWQAAATTEVDPDRRRELFGRRLPEEATTPGRRTLGSRINDALTDEMIRYGELIVFGEDVGKKGGVYGVTQHLQERFGAHRVFDTLLDETTILGVAQGSGMFGLLPIPEIPYLAYLHNAVDQLRGEACSLQFFSNLQFANPMVVRIASFAYQKGFGGHFHNDNSIGGIRDIPGLTIVTPARGDDAARLLRGAVAMAAVSGRVVVFLEPIALYHERDLYEKGDGGWLSDYPAPGGSDSALLPGEVGVYHPEHTDLCILTYANGVRMALQAARELESQGLRARVIDLRWLKPLPLEAVSEHAAACGAVLVADECRATGGGVADALIAHLVETGYRGRLASVRSDDTYIPLGDAANLVLLQTEDITRKAQEVLA